LYDLLHPTVVKHGHLQNVRIAAFGMYCYYRQLSIPWTA